MKKKKEKQETNRRGGGGAVIKNVREKRKRGMVFLKRLIVCVWLGGGVRKEAFPTLCVSDGDKKVVDTSIPRNRMI